ncbi:DNA helicase PcrA [Sporomusa sphaeroides]|jgi:DNA helicase-2/ATP-dependent DNA helicase PcrA|uniref:ATP-dependent DNA helicase n=1 Tax=Sporomusa sphaeroides DSM 2875 TaxID=1337886 RepID=A0ABM9W2Y4_9FIRM|nr:DNA helicase PcrA [Sporomusa sphaeroides]MCM0759804.1 DNA helicase PcrA [Sporomusa sphaeroides DSM 2875]OLS55747.1 ATP-dependent DNA helicase PcrA [Sporomusa sphaeroides DSM 2875]CVK19327.1 ATP-dependent DNA helicase PcrA [Sporomusa sphaeroides DSM 2875]
MNNIFDRLNPAQQEAVAHVNGPLLIMAGAGSGKTKVLTSRIANLLAQGVAPYNILAITFTNKAAAEMKARVAGIVGLVAKDIWLSTFHAFCAKFLRMEIENLGGYTRNFVIYDAGDSQSLIKTCLKELNLDEKQFTPGGVQSTISNAKNALQDVREFTSQADNFYNLRVAEVYKLYQSKLKVHNALDFDDLLMLSVELLEYNATVREKYQQKFHYILIDEYQDTNRAQYLLARRLAAKHRNICVVGDVDQSIYAWRGADIQNILDFESDYPDAKVIKLEQNYRSTQTILDAANAVIENNCNRKPKSLWTDNQAGDTITHYLAMDERDEARYITDNIVKLNTVYRTPYKDIAILYRTNAQSRTIEEGLRNAAIPYTMVGGLRFYDRKEIKDIMAYIKVLFNPADAVSLLRIINVPRRGIGNTTIGRLEEYAAGQGVPLFDAVSNPDLVPGLTKRAKHQLEGLAELIFNLMSCQNTLPVPELVDKVMRDSGYLAELEADSDPQAMSRIENLKELVSDAKKFAETEAENTLEEFLSHVSLLTDLDNNEFSDDKVTLMTLHSAKGLEFPVVFLAGLEEGIFPHVRTLMDEREIEEERRLCYVGITRAERKLYISNARQRMIYGNTVCYSPSRFLDEIPPELMERYAPGRPAYLSSMPGSRPVAAASLPKAAVKPELTILKSPVQNPAKPQNLEWKAGEKVYHAKWGTGTVVAVSGSGDNMQLSIAFPNEGIKKLLAQLAPISRV